MSISLVELLILPSILLQICTCLGNNPCFFCIHDVNYNTKSLDTSAIRPMAASARGEMVSARGELFGAMGGCGTDLH